MTRSIFGWSYPPGCSGPPDEPEDCPACGASNLDHCVCPECPVCESFGDLECYRAHNLIYSFPQLRGMATVLENARKANEAECRWEEEHLQ